MLTVDLHNILSEEEAAGQIRELFDRVASSKDVVAITRAGHPALALIEVTKLEELLGMKMQTESTTMPPELPVAPAAAAFSEAPTLPDLPPMPDMPDMPSMSSMPSAPSAPLMSTPPSSSMAVPSALPLNDSPMNEPAPMTETIVPTMPVAPAAAPASPAAAQPSATPTAPVPPMPIMTHFGEDLPDMPSDPSNGSPLA